MGHPMQIITNKAVRENPMLKVVLAVCPALGASTTGWQALSLGLATVCALVASNLLIAIIRKMIPSQVVIPVYATLVAGVVSVVEMLMNAYYPTISRSLGIYLPLMVVNCMIMGCSEHIFPKNDVVLSTLEGFILGIAFTFTLTLVGILREIIGLGTCFGVAVLPHYLEPFTVMSSATGGFFMFGLFMAVVALLTTPRVNLPETIPQED